MKNFHAVIFDMDGLLLDTERIALGCFLETCAYFGIEDHIELFVRCIGTNQALGEQILKEGLRGKVDYLEFGRIWDKNYTEKTSKEPVPLKAGAMELLEYLELRQVPTAVATSTNSEKAKQKLLQTGILNHFNAVIGGDQVERGKPNPDIYLEASRAIGIKPDKCLALEDSENGVRSAMNAGMAVIQVPDLVQPSPALLEYGHIVLSSLNAVVDYLSA